MLIDETMSSHVQSLCDLEIEVFAMLQLDVDAFDLLSSGLLAYATFAPSDSLTDALRPNPRYAIRV